MSKMPLAITGFAALIATIVLLAIVKTTPPAPSLEDSAPLSVQASFYPLAEFARQVGGDLVTVGTITPDGVEPHDYGPTPSTIAKIYSADIFLWNGDGIDSWALRVAAEVEAKGVVTAQMSTISEIENTSDTHFWLDPMIAAAEVDLIAKTLSKVDPANAETFAGNASSYKQKLLTLDADYRQGLAECDSRLVVTSHDAFAYLAKAYNFETIAITGISPEEEPSAGRLSEIAKLAQEKQIKYIYFETLVSPKLAQTIADEIGAQTLILNPIEGLTTADAAAGKNYLSIMRENLTNLQTGMLCR